MIRYDNGIFFLNTNKTSYIFRMTDRGHPEHIYYGSRLDDPDVASLELKRTAAVGGAVGNAVVGAVVIMSGISAADGDPDKVSESGLLMMKSAMLIIPLILIVLGFIVYKLFFRIDKEKYDLIITDLKARGDISEDAN